MASEFSIYLSSYRSYSAYLAGISEWNKQTMLLTKENKSKISSSSLSVKEVWFSYSHKEILRKTFPQVIICILLE
jgi:hypothetical protein